MAQVFKHTIMADDRPTANTQAVKAIDDEALKNAYATGFEEGLKQGIQQGQVQWQRSVESLNALIQSIPTAISEHRLQLSAEIADIVLQVTQPLFIRHVENQDPITHQIHQVLKQLNANQIISIAVHPNDLALINTDDYPVRWLADDNLQLGGCIIRSEHGVFDTSIEQQIERFKQVLLDLKLRNHS